MDEFGMRAQLSSFYYAARGIAFMLRTERNARIHALASLGVGVAGIVLEISKQEWILVLLAATSVWTAEAINTAFESLCDVASPEFHPLVERAKDIAAGAVLIAASAAAAVGMMIFAPKLWAL